MLWGARLVSPVVLRVESTRSVVRDPATGEEAGPSSALM